MSSQIVRKLLWASNRASAREDEIDGSEKAKRKRKMTEQPNGEVSSESTTTTEDIINLQVNYMLSIDQDESSKLRKAKKRRKVAVAPSSRDAVAAIVTNSRGSAAASKRVKTATFNKHRHQKEQKAAYFEKIARQLQKDERKYKKTKK
mmetsp:Transcript_4054/g.8688  ORF Transcript_4054/g.8688 Transcript_4054/m.8688 type:complete len:148 (+) Transcript_4054:80-523(+)